MLSETIRPPRTWRNGPACRASSSAEPRGCSIRDPSGRPAFSVVGRVTPGGARRDPPTQAGIDRWVALSTAQLHPPYQASFRTPYMNSVPLPRRYLVGFDPKE